MKNLLTTSPQTFMQKLSNGVAFLGSFFVTMPDSTENKKYEDSANPSFASYDEVYQKGYKNGYKKSQEVAKINVKGITLEPHAYFLFVKDMFDALTLNYKHAESEREFLADYIHYLKHIRKIALELKNTNMRYETAFEKLLTEIDQILELVYENNDKAPLLTTGEALYKKENAGRDVGERFGKIVGFLEACEAFPPENVNKYTLDSLNNMKKTIAEVRRLDYYACRSEFEIVFEGLQTRLDKIIAETEAKMPDTPLLKNADEFDKGRKFGELEGYAKGVKEIYTQFGLNREEIARPIFKALYERLQNATPPEVAGLDLKKTLSDLAVDVGTIYLDQLKDQVTTRGLDKKALTLEEIPTSHAESTALVLKHRNTGTNRTFFLTGIFKRLVSPNPVTLKASNLVSGGSTTIKNSGVPQIEF